MLAAPSTLVKGYRRVPSRMRKKDVWSRGEDQEIKGSPIHATEKRIPFSLTVSANG